MQMARQKLGVYLLSDSDLLGYYAFFTLFQMEIRKDAFYMKGKRS